MAAQEGTLAAARAAALAASSDLLLELGLGGAKRSMDAAAGSISSAKAAKRRAKTARRSAASAASQRTDGPRRRSMRVAGLDTEGGVVDPATKSSIAQYTPPPRPQRKPGALALGDDDVVREGSVELLQNFLVGNTAGKGTRERLPWTKLTIRHDHHAVKAVGERIYSVAFHPGSTPVAFTGDKKGTLGIWRPSSGEVVGGGDLDPYEAEEGGLVALKLHSGPINALAATQDTVMTCSYEGCARVLDLHAGVFRESYAHWPEEGGPRATPLQYADLSADGKVLVAASRVGEVAVVDTRTLSAGISAVDRSSAEALVVDAHDAKIASVSLHPDGVHLATAAHDSSVRIWDLRKMTKGKKLGKVHSGTSLTTLQHGGSATSAFWSACGSRLVSTANDDFIRVWEGGAGATGDATVSIAHNNHTGRWLSNFRAVFDPADSETVVVGAMTVRHVQAFSAVTGKALAGKGDELLTAVPTLNAVHPSLPLVVSGTASGRLHMWSARDW